MTAEQLATLEEVAHRHVRSLFEHARAAGAGPVQVTYGAGVRREVCADGERATLDGSRSIVLELGPSQVLTGG